MTGETKIPVCRDEDCDSTKIFVRNGKSAEAEPGTWKCSDCGTTFDEPRWRAQKVDPGAATGGLSPAGKAALKEGTGG